jgi:RNA polymerase sigma-70 factor (ECF subfamily)
MSEANRREVRAGLEACLARLWRYAVVLSRSRDTADDLVQATCLRAIERADQFAPGTRVDRWLLSILRSIWLNEVRARRIRRGSGVVDAEQALTSDGAKAIETNILAAEVFNAIDRLPETQRKTVLLVSGGGFSYAEAASAVGDSGRHRNESRRRRTLDLGQIEGAFQFRWPMMTPSLSP